MVVQPVAGSAQLPGNAGFRPAGQVYRLLGGDTRTQLLGIAHGGRQNLVHYHVDHGLCLDCHNLIVGIQMNPVPGAELRFGEHPMPGDKVDVFLTDVSGQSLRGGGKVA